MLLNSGIGEDSWESFDSKEIQPVHPKRNQSWIFIGRTDAEAEASILWPPDAKNWLIGKGPDVGKGWRQEKKGAREDEMVGWHHWLNGHEFEQAPGDGEGQGRLASWSLWVTKSQTLSDWAAEHLHRSPAQSSRSAVSDSSRPHEPQHARPPCPSPTPRAYSNSCWWSRWCHPTISSSVIPFSSCLQSFQDQGLFQWGNSSHQVDKALESQLQHQFFQWIFMIDFLYDFLWRQHFLWRQQLVQNRWVDNLGEILVVSNWCNLTEVLGLIVSYGLINVTNYVTFFFACFQDYCFLHQ